MQTLEVTAPTETTDRNGPPPNVKLLGVVLGLTVVIALMLLAFVLPSINSGPHDLKLGVAGPAPATERIETGLAHAKPGAFETQTFDDADAVRSAIEHRDIAGGLVVTEDGPTMLVASAGGAPIEQTLTAVAAGLGESTGRQIPVVDVVPLPEEDPTGVGLAMLAFPLVFGGMIPAVALVTLFPGSLRRRLIGAAAFAILAGLTLTAIMQFAIGSFTGNYVLTSGAVAMGIAAISFTVLGLESLLGLPGLGLGAVTMVFVANPLAGMATTAAWLPSGWGAVGQLLPPGAAGTAIRSIVYFDGHGATESLAVLMCWIAIGLTMCVVANMRARRSVTTA